MATVHQLFHDFMTTIELTDDDEKKVARHQRELRERVRADVDGVVRDVLIGSVARKTAIRPLNDVDLFLVLDPTVHGARRKREPTVLLHDLQRELLRCYPDHKTRIQGRSVKIEFSSDKISYDVIPALLTKAASAGKDAVYEIPNRKAENWIETNPELHKKRCQEANHAAGDMLNRLIKAAKCWNQCHRSNDHKPLRSFHLEAMTYQAFKPGAPPTHQLRGLRHVFKSLESGLSSPCPDPAGLGPNIDCDLSDDERQHARKMLGEAVRVADEALRYEELGDHSNAWGRWRSLLTPKS